MTPASLQVICSGHLQLFPALLHGKEEKKGNVFVRFATVRISSAKESCDVTPGRARAHTHTHTQCVQTNAFLFRRDAMYFQVSNLVNPRLAGRILHRMQTPCLPKIHQSNWQNTENITGAPYVRESLSTGGISKLLQQQKTRKRWRKVWGGWGGG